MTLKPFDSHILVSVYKYKNLTKHELISTPFITLQ